MNAIVIRIFKLTHVLQDHCIDHKTFESRSSIFKRLTLNYSLSSSLPLLRVFYLLDNSFWANSASYVYRNRYAKRGAQVVPI